MTILLPIFLFVVWLFWIPVCVWDRFGFLAAAVRPMRALFVGAHLMMLAGCATQAPGETLVGTWRMRLPEPGSCYLRIYPDGTVAIWPSPPDGQTAWTKLKGDTLAFGYREPLLNPRLSRRGGSLVMHDNVSDKIFDRIPDEIEPPK